ncbi:hypothetical protein QE152_g22101 [Popillia japonica]|uniref:Uncharacterized protein n=1 Tax=Popillia japonica TaxID=7064 RepID=A0AAW1KMI2_POPJA
MLTFPETLHLVDYYDEVLDTHPPSPSARPAHGNEQLFRFNDVFVRPPPPLAPLTGTNSSSASTMYSFCLFAVFPRSSAVLTTLSCYTAESFFSSAVLTTLSCYTAESFFGSYCFVLKIYDWRGNGEGRNFTRRFNTR